MSRSRLSKKDNPTIECCCSPFAASARLDPERMGNPLDHLSEADLLILDEPRQAHTKGRYSFFLFSLFGHGPLTSPLVAFSVSYAIDAFSSGGMIERRAPSPIIARRSWAALTRWNTDQSNATAPVTNGAAALLPVNVA
jgi:hypothetical protein